MTTTTTTTTTTTGAPAAALTDRQVRILGAVIDVYARNTPHRATSRQVAAASGDCVDVVRNELHQLAAAGLVADVGVNGGLRPLVAVVAASPW